MSRENNIGLCGKKKVSTVQLYQGLSPWHGHENKEAGTWEICSSAFQGRVPRYIEVRKETLNKP